MYLENENDHFEFRYLLRKKKIKDIERWKVYRITNISREK